MYINIWERFMRINTNLSKYYPPHIISITSTERVVLFETNSTRLVLEFDVSNSFLERKLPCVLMFESTDGRNEHDHGDLFELDFFRKVREILDTYFIIYDNHLET